MSRNVFQSVTGRISCLVFFLSVLFFAGTSFAEDGFLADEQMVQVMLGFTSLDNDDSSFPSCGEDGEMTLKSTVSTLPTIGCMLQIPFNTESRQIGLEGGIDGSWWTDQAKIVGGDGKTYIHLDNSMALVDLYYGIFASTDPAEKWRAYAGAGGILSWGFMEIESCSDPDDTETESSFGPGLYVRAGVEFKLSDGNMMGIGARYTSSGIDFSNSYGSFDVDSIRFMITYTAFFLQDEF